MNTIKQLSIIALKTKEIIKSFRIQDFFHGQHGLSALLKDTEKLPAECITELTDTLKDIMEAQQNKDNILIADLLEVQFLPYIETILQQSIINEPNSICINYLDENLRLLKNDELSKKIRLNADSVLNSDRYAIEASNIGSYIVKSINPDHSFYYHSNVNPIDEGNQFATYYSRNNCFDYIIFGFGFGYHISAMLRLDRRFRLSVLETNLDILTLAFIYCDLKDILSNPRFTLHFIDYNEIGHYLNKNTVNSDRLFLIHYPSMMDLSDGEYKKLLNNYFINISSMLSQQKFLDWNFYYNIQFNDAPIDVLSELFFNKTVVYIAGGPSLEYYIMLLQDNSFTSDKIIICASTVYKKLLENKIIPDFVIMIDAKDNMVNHIKDAPKNTSSLIYLCTACNAAVREFPNKRYICFQNGYEDAENYANINNLMLINTGGSVSTSAIDLVLQLKCCRLITIGLDLAYTDNKSHSFEPTLNKTSELIPVKSVSGGIIYTTNVLHIYHKWIEQRIKSIDTELINLSHGAYIDGMYNVEMLDYR